MRARATTPAPAPPRVTRTARSIRAVRSRVSRATRTRATNQGSGDFITDVVTKIFGADAVADPEPFGLKRMSKEEWPDQWPAELDADAETLESDVGELRTIRRVLKQTQLERLRLGLAYDAEEHGWSATSFHSRVDGYGAGILVAETKGGEVFGGYNPKGWLGYGEWNDAISAFVYVFEGRGRPVKVPKVGGSGMAIIDEDGKGPQWGPDGLKINLESRSARSRLGSYYANEALARPSLFREGKPGESIELRSVRVYVALEDTEIAKSYEPNVLQWQKGELEDIRKDDDSENPPMDGFFGKLFGGKK